MMSALFDAYALKSFPERLIGPGEPEPLFMETVHDVETTAAKSDRVWAGVLRKADKPVCNMLTHVWLSEIERSDELIFRYIRKVFDSPHRVVLNFGDDDVLEVHKIARKVSREREHIMQFVRFQKADDDTFFAPIAPLYNALPLSLAYFKDRFADQKWLIYDMKRRYGYYYDLKTVTEITLPDADRELHGKLDPEMMADDEKLFQDLWKSYFKALTIRQRINPKLQRQHMPRRFWKYITEMQ